MGRIRLLTSDDPTHYFACDAISPDAPAKKEVRHWNRIILHKARVFVDPTWGVLFKILMALMPPMVRTAIIEYAH